MSRKGIYAKAARSPKAIRARILLVAQERSLRRSDVDRALKASSRFDKQSSIDAFIDFANSHRLSLDWILFGDLRGVIAARSAAE